MPLEQRHAAVTTMSARGTPMICAFTSRSSMWTLSGSIECSLQAVAVLLERHCFCVAETGVPRKKNRLL
jgi:hypothetical protein